MPSSWTPTKPKPKLRAGYNEADYTWDPGVQNWVPIPLRCEACPGPNPARYGINGRWLCTEHYISYWEILHGNSAVGPLTS